jgi:hypothetical protein
MFPCESLIVSGQVIAAESPQNAISHQGTGTFDDNFTGNSRDRSRDLRIKFFGVVFRATKEIGQKLAFVRSYDPLIFEQSVGEKTKALAGIH